jgi:dihydroorotase
MDPVTYDLVVENGIVVSSTTTEAKDVAVLDGKIAAIGGPFPRAERRIDARGRHVLPGIWHVHCHFRDPGHTYKEDFETGTRAAAAGGITFCVDMTNNDPHPTSLDTFEQKKEIVAPKAYVDYGLYGGGLYPKTVEALAKAGAIGIKVFNTRHIKEVYPYISELGVLDHGILYELYEATRDVGLIAAVHHDDPEWVKRLTFRDYIDRGRTDYAAYIDSHSKGYMYGHGMAAGLASSLYYAGLVGVHLHVLHMGLMPPGAFEMVRHAKFDLGQKVSSELDFASMINTPEHVAKVGPRSCFTPSFPEESWKSIASGVSDVLVLEHAPHTLEEIEPGWRDMFSIPLGGTGIQEFVPMLLNSVNEGRLTLQDAVRLCSERPAQIFGQYPNKGAVAVGSDADLTIVDMGKEVVFRDKDMLSRTGFTSWVGLKAKGAAVGTIVRGRPVMSDGKILGEPGYGRFTPGTAASA